MKTKTLKFLLPLVAFATLLPTAALAQLTQTLNFTIDQTTGNGVNLLFNKFELASFQSFTVTLTLTSITDPGTDPNNTGYFQGSQQTPAIPSATFTETLTLFNVPNPPAAITATDNYTAASPLAQNNDETIVIPTTGPNSFSVIPQSSVSTITGNLANFEQSPPPSNTQDGTFDLNVNVSPSVSNVENANIQSFHPIINGTLTVSTVPEPSTWVMLFAGVALAIGLRAHKLLA